MTRLGDDNLSIICAVSALVIVSSLRWRDFEHWRLASTLHMASTRCQPVTTFTWAEKFESFERINSIRETNGNFYSCNSCKRLVPSRLHELHESKFPFVSRIEFIRSKLSNFSAHVNVVSVRFRPPGSVTAAGVTQRVGTRHKYCWCCDHEACLVVAISA